MKIYDARKKQEYLKEIALLTQLEWGKKIDNEQELEQKIKHKIWKMKKYFEHPYYCKLILLDKKELVGFISIFPHDGEERKDLTPWYATMYVKSEYRKKGYSKILHSAILKEAKKRGIKKIYLKTELNNYYEKWGAKYMQLLQNGEKLYYFDLEEIYDKK